MPEKRNIQDYAKLIYELGDSPNPTIIGGLYNEVCAKLIYLYTVRGELYKKKAIWKGENADVIALTVQKIGNQLSDTLLNRHWDANEDGQKLTKVEHEVKALKFAEKALTAKRIDHSQEMKMSQNVD